MFSQVAAESIGLTDADLVEQMEHNELERRRLDAEMSAMLAVGKARNLHGVQGHRSMTAFCRARFNWSTTEAGRRLSAARACDGLDGLGDAWSAGRFGMSQAQKLSLAYANARVRDQLEEFVPDLLMHAEQMPYRDFAVVVDHVIARADEDGAHDDRDAEVEGRRARVVGVGGTLDVRASGGDALTAAEMVAIHERFVDAEFRADVEATRRKHGDDADVHSLPRTDRQRRFDALVAIFRSAASADGAGSSAEPLVNIAIDARTWGRLLLDSGLSTSSTLDGHPVDPFTGLAVDDLDDVLDLAGSRARMCATSNGVPLHPHDVLTAALAGHVRRAVVDSDRVVIDLGRRQRLFTGSARQAARLLVTRCEHVGCELPVEWCDVDHVDEWGRDGGRTDQANAAVLCRFHNQQKHRERWRTRRARNGCSYTVDADGTIIMPVGARAPDLGGPDPNRPHGDGGDDNGDDEWFDSPETIARLTTIARNRLDQLPPPAWLRPTG